MRGLRKDMDWMENRLALLRIMNVPRWLTRGEIAREFRKVATSDSTLHKHLKSAVSEGLVSYQPGRYIITEKGMSELRHLQRESSKTDYSGELPTVHVHDAAIVRIPSTGPGQGLPSCSGTLAYEVEVSSPYDGSPTISQDIQSEIGSCFSRILELIPGSHRVEIHFGGNRSG